MGEGLNRVVLLGNIGQDPDLRTLQGGQIVLKIRMATTETYTDREKNRQERTEWHTVSVWGQRAEALSKILSKGQQILVEGSLRTSSYEKNGEKRYSTEVNAQNVVLLSGGGQAHDADGVVDDAPAARPLRGGAPQPRHVEQRAAAPEQRALPVDQGPSRAYGNQGAPRGRQAPARPAPAPAPAYERGGYPDGPEDDIPF